MSKVLCQQEPPWCGRVIPPTSLLARPGRKHRLHEAVDDEWCEIVAAVELEGNTRSVTGNTGVPQMLHRIQKAGEGDKGRRIGLHHEHARSVPANVVRVPPAQGLDPH